MKSNFPLPRVLTTITILLVVGLAAVLGGKATSRQSKTAQSQGNLEAREVVLNSSDESEIPDTSRTGVVALSQDRLLIRVEDVLYLLNSNSKVVWQTFVDQMIDMPVADSTGMLYGIRVDHTLFAINSNNGEGDCFSIGPKSGRDYYTQIKAYTNDQYLVVTSMQPYRDNACPECRKANDYVTACVGKQPLWGTEIPPNAKIEIWQDKIFAVSARKGEMVVQEIPVPLWTGMSTPMEWELRHRQGSQSQ